MLTFILALIFTPTALSAVPLICERNQFDTCSFESGIIAGIVIYAITGLLVITSLILTVTGFLIKNKK